MAGQNGKRTSKRRTSLDTYFYLNDELHKRLEIDRSKDVLIAWSYPQRKRVGYTYSDVRKRAKKAYTTRQVGQLLNRAKYTCQMLIVNGVIPAPQQRYGLSDIQKPSWYMWADKDIYAARQAFSERQTNGGIPSERELRAMLEHGTILYVKTDDGDFVPTWEAENF